jgi:hypothetical protein
MSAETRAPQESAAAAGTKFKDLSTTGKVVWIAKFVVFLISFGFAFPTILSD